MGKHRTEVTEATEGGLRLVGELAPATPLGWGARNTRQWESIAQRSQRPQRGIEVGGSNLCRRPLGWDAETRSMGKHRTEVTEATEGD